MARVRLSRDEVDELPPVCLRCGAPTTLVRERTFTWHPSWIDWLIIGGLILFWPLLVVGIVLVAVMTKRMRVAVPLCEAHRGYWQRRAWFIWGGLAVVAPLAIGTVAFLFSVIQAEDPDRQAVAGWTCAGAGLIGLVWLIAVAFLQRSVIAPAEITDDEITLSQVSPAFKEALERRRGEEDAAEEERRRAHFRKGSGETGGIYDPEAKKPGHLPPDAYRTGDE